MRWFKHYSDNHRGQSIQYLLDELGYFGPFFYYLIYEMCAEKLEKRLAAKPTDTVHRSDAGLEPDDCTFSFHQRVVCSASRAKPSTVGRALDAGQSCGLWTFSLNGVVIEISVPILLNLLDRDQKKTRLKRAQNAPKTRLDKDKDKDKEEDKDEERVPNPKKHRDNAAQLNSLIWAAYHESFLNRYAVEPPRNATINSQVSALGKRLGADAVEVVKFYVSHNNSFYLRQSHAIGLCLKDAESLHTQWQRGKPITNAELRLAERYNQDALLNKMIDEGKI